MPAWRFGLGRGNCRVAGVTVPTDEPRVLSKYERDVLQAAEENHIWINAFTLVRPTDKTLIEIGRAVVNMLATQEETIVAEFHRPGAIFADISGPMSRELVVRINQS